MFKKTIFFLQQKVRKNTAKFGTKTKKSMEKKNMKQIWEQTPEETNLKYQYFQDYLKQGPQRSLKKTAQLNQKSQRIMEKYSAQYNWPRRAEEYDTHQRQQRAQEMEDQWQNLNKLVFNKSISMVSACNLLFLEHLKKILKRSTSRKHNNKYFRKNSQNHKTTHRNLQHYQWTPRYDTTRTRNHG